MKTDTIDGWHLLGCKLLLFPADFIAVNISYIILQKIHLLLWSSKSILAQETLSLGKEKTAPDENIHRIYNRICKAENRIYGKHQTLNSRLCFLEKVSTQVRIMQNSFYLWY